MCLPIMKTHPCMKCGACCSFFRVMFHWSETLPDSYNVPDELITEASQHLNAMKGTSKKDPHCIALEGKVGELVSCKIYDRRPSCCRNFQASYENGIKNHRCDQARAGKGLAALTLSDWDGLQPEPTVEPAIQAIEI